MTAFPPPIFKPEMAAFLVMASAKRRTSCRASFSFLYGHIRIPPRAGPSRVECTAMIPWKLAEGSFPTTTVSNPLILRCFVLSILFNRLLKKTASGVLGPLSCSRTVVYAALATTVAPCGTQLICNLRPCWTGLFEQPAQPDPKPSRQRATQE